VRYASHRIGRKIQAIDAEAMKRLVQHNWPGNVRELKHVIEAAVALSNAETLRVRDLIDADFHAGDEEDSDSDSLSRLARQEKQQIVTALRENGWVQKRAAHALGISGRVIHYKIRKFGIKLPSS
jgi:transcriptional regulator of acetoin/glycerol metabolism